MVAADRAIASEILYFQWSRITPPRSNGAIFAACEKWDLPYSISVAGIRNTARYRSPR